MTDNKSKAADNRSAWSRVVARMNGKRAPAEDAGKEASPAGWAKVVARFNKTNRPIKERAPAGGVKMKSTSKINAGRW